MHHTLFGRAPKSGVALQPDLSVLWSQARRFQPGKHRRSPFPTHEEAAYLLDVANRVCRHGHLPTSLTLFDNGEASYYVPNDDMYRVDDLF